MNELQQSPTLQATRDGKAQAHPDIRKSPKASRSSLVVADEIVVTVRSAQSGFLRILEAWDPGWQAWIDGAESRVLPADDCFTAIPLGPGTHTVRMEFHTPGARAGLCISLASLLGLFFLTWDGYHLPP